MSDHRIYLVDESNEIIYLTEGWCDLNRGWFCKLERKGLNIESFGSTRRQALRIARRFWHKKYDERNSNCNLPRVVG